MTDRKKTILLVEDEALLAMAEAKMLEGHDFTVITVHNGKDAVSAVDSTPGIDLILMDIDLGKDMDGTAAAKQILEKHDLPLVFLSSHTEPEIVEKTEGITSYGYIVKASGEMVLMASIKMAFRLFEEKQNVKIHQQELSAANEEIESTCEELEASYEELENTCEELAAANEQLEEKQRELVEHEAAICFERDRARRYIDLAGVIILALDTEGKITLINKTGCEERDLIGKTWFDTCLPQPEGRETVYPVFQKIMSGDIGPVEFYENVIMTRDGRPRDISWHNAILHDESGNISGTLSAGEDITERKKAEEKLRQNEQFLSAVYNNSDIGIFMVKVHDNGKYVYEGINPAHERFLGIQNSFITGKGPTDLVDTFGHEAVAYITGLYDDCVKRRETIESEFYIPEGPARGWWFSRLSPIIDEGPGEVTRLIGSGIIITERKKMEDEIKRLLSEKDALLRELNHRIKNSISSISNLIYLQLKSVKNEEALNILSDTMNRVSSMQLLYDKIQISGDPREISVPGYLNELIVTIRNQYAEHAHILITGEFDDFSLNSKVLFPLGLIINELVTNSMKHAFAGKPDGLVNISLVKSGAGVRLMVKDNGNGLPPGFQLHESKGFGLRLVDMLTRQFKGAFTIDEENGTACTVELEV